MSDYYSRIMNIPSKESEYEYVPCQIYSYKEGHRDARHVSAEIVLESEREIEKLKDCIDGLVETISTLEEYCGDLQSQLM